MLFYDFEVFKYDWLTVIMDMTAKKEIIFVNQPEEFSKFLEEHKNDIWVGFNNRHYDQYIAKSIVCGFDPKRVNDYIIVKDKRGWQFSSLFSKIQMINYDVMSNTDRGLKAFEGFMGNNIKETSVPFDIDRKLTEAEIQETIKYCRHDVEQTIEVFIHRKSDFEAQMGLLKMFDVPLNGISKTKVQLSADILGAVRKDYHDEFDIDFPDTMKIEKYSAVVDWYKNPENRCYSKHIPGKKTPEKSQLEIMVAGIPHVFGWGGVHGAIEKYHGKGYFINMDVGSLYPSLMCRYNLMSRSVPSSGFQRFKDIREYRLKLKHEGKKKEQAPLKIVLNGTYGAMKDKNNNLFDPLQANRVCVYGQLLLLDLIERLEPYADIIQSNTDGVLIKMPEDPRKRPWMPGKSSEDIWFSVIDDIAWEWEQRTGLDLEFDEYREIYQKDVNNYIIIDGEGHFKSKGAYVKELSALDYDLPIVNKALVNYMVKDIPIETTITECSDLKEFQLVSKISSKYKHILHGDKIIGEKCIRIFASLDPDDEGVKKVSVRTGKPEKISNSPEHCFLWNDNINDVTCPGKLDRQWYVDMAKKRLMDFGVMI